MIMNKDLNLTLMIDNDNDNDEWTADDIISGMDDMDYIGFSSRNSIDAEWEEALALIDELGWSEGKEDEDGHGRNCNNYSTGDRTC